MIVRKPGRGWPVLSLLPLMICLLSPAVRGQTIRPPHFDRIMPREPGGQPFPLVHCLIQDRQGFIWIAGPNGLARYDGNSFLFFSHSETDPSSLSDDHLFNVFEDSRGDIWVTSNKGLDRLDRKNGGFRHFRHDPADPGSLSSDRIRAICEDRTGALWIGTVDGGLNRLDRERTLFTRYVHDPGDPNSPGSDSIWALCCARDGRLWIGATESGLDCYDPESGTWSHYNFRAGDPSGPSDRHYWALCEGQDGRIWIGTNEGGLDCLAPATGTFSRTRLGDRFPRKGDHRILALREDRDGTLWIGTDNQGLFRLDRDSRLPVRYSAEPERSGGLSHNLIMSIIEDRQGLLWFGTGNGLSVLNKGRTRFPAVRPGGADGEGLNDGDVLSLFEDPDGILWIGTANGGLNRWNRETGSWALDGLDSGFLEFLGKVQIQAITGDARGDLWFGTSSGLVRYRKSAGSFTCYRSLTSRSVLPSNSISTLAPGRPGFLWAGTKDGGVFEWDIDGEKAGLFPWIMNDELSQSNVNDVLVDREGWVWIASHWRGIVRVDPESHRWKEYRRHPEDPRSLPSSTVYAIAEDGAGRIWAGTHAGPCLFDAAAGGWIRLSEALGLPEGPVYGIVPDRDGNVWMSMETRLVKIRLEPELRRIYGPGDGLQGGHFNPGAAIRRRDGEIVFGGTQGFNHFFPSAIADDPYLPPLAVTAIDLSAPRGSIVFLGAPETVDIPKSRFPVTVVLSALSYSHPGRNRFRVRVPDLEDRIFDLGTNRHFHLDILKTGRNRFVFYAANHDGVWNPEGQALTIRVTVPFRQSWVWRAALAALAAASVWAWSRMGRRRSKRRLLHQIGEDLIPLYSRFDLTNREKEVLSLILQGKSNREIETELFISGKTVKNHIYNLYQKVGVKSRLELVNAVKNLAGREP